MDPKGNKEKKARSFDFMAMFEQARQTAVERTSENIEQGIAAAITTESGSKSSSSDSSDSSGSDSDSESEDDNKKTDLKINSKDAAAADGDDDDMIGPPLPPGMEVKQTARNSDDEDEDDSDTEENEDNRIPTSHEILLQHGVKMVSALSLDPSGSRLVTGSIDFDMKFWDFAGMDSSLNSFRSLRPCECHQIKNLQYSTTGDVILVVAGNAQAKIIDRDGFEVLECPKGDQYIIDQSNTRGHTAMLNSGCWHPKIREEYMTCSNDGTVRLWDINNKMKQKNVIKPKSKLGRKTIPTACSYSSDGRYVAAACQDGSIQIWDHTKHFVNVALKNMSAHMNGSDTSCLCFSYDGRTLASRGGDDSLKLWDIRSFKTPLQSLNGLTSFYPMTDCVFSPDDKLIVTGTSVKKGEGIGKLLFFDRLTVNKVTEFVMGNTSVVRCLWHPKLNQIVVGCGDGCAKVYYDPQKSHRGAMLCVVKKQWKTKQVEALTEERIITPYALPMFREVAPTNTKKYEERVRKDPLKTKRPDLPVYGPGSGGRLGAKGATLSQYVSQQLVKPKADKMDENPREAILRHAKEAEDNPYWVTPAYKKNQPTAVFQEEEEEEEHHDGPSWKKTKVS